VIPAEFAHTIREVHGEAGARWLEELPGLLDWCERTWRVKASQPFSALSYNYAAPGLTESGAEIVVKLGVPTRELLREMAALEAFGGRGAVRLLECDPSRGAMLLERLRPGLSLDRSPEGQLTAARNAAGVLRELWRPAPVPHGWKVQDWISEMDRKTPNLLSSPAGKRFPDGWLRRARELSERSGGGEPVLLHGDFHHGNILSDGAGWRAIDAWGIIGSREWEIGGFLLNAIPKESDPVRELLHELLEVFGHELELDREKVRDLSIARAVLSAFWTLEDHARGWDVAIRVAESLAAL
jgi:streptomycin 6-kinase